jgi:hypothetical protein
MNLTEIYKSKTEKDKFEEMYITSWEQARPGKLAIVETLTNPDIVIGQIIDISICSENQLHSCNTCPCNRIGVLFKDMKGVKYNFWSCIVKKLYDYMPKSLKGGKI